MERKVVLITRGRFAPSSQHPLRRLVDFRIRYLVIAMRGSKAGVMASLALLLVWSAPANGQNASTSGPWDAAISAYDDGDYRKAITLFYTFGEAGDATAQSMLGWMYDNGEGVPENDVEAVRWYRMAADQGDANAQTMLGLKYGLGEGVPQNYSEAYFWLILAAAPDDVVEVARKRLTRGQIAEAQARAARWRPK